VGFPARLVMDGVDDFYSLPSVAYGGALHDIMLARFNPASSNLVFHDPANTSTSFIGAAEAGGLALPSHASIGTPATFINGSLLSPDTSGELYDRTQTPNVMTIQSAVLSTGARQIGGYASFHLRGDIFSLHMIVKRQMTSDEKTAAEKAFGKAIGVLQ